MKILVNFFLIFLITSCANMVAPIGGDKDLDAPELITTITKESFKNGFSKTITFEFNEYIQLNNWDKNFYISPPIKNTPKKKINGETLFVTIEGVTNKNRTYYISLNSCIKDNNEGNILDTLDYKFSITDNFDTLTLSGTLEDAYTLKPLENAWVMLFNEDEHDTLIFKETPNYISKTNKNGIFHFPNLKNKDYKIVALTGFDFIYNKEEKIAFIDSFVNAKRDSIISLLAFDPINEDRKIDSIALKSDSIKDTSIEYNGKLEIITNKNSSCIVQLLQNEKVINETYFSTKPYLIEAIIPGKYQLKYISDSNQDSIWNTGIWNRKIQPERVANYPSEITIRSNWDLQLEWIIQE